MTKSELLEKIIERPSLYVGKPSVVSIEVFVSGFALGCGQAGIDTKDELYDGFHDWLVKRYGFGHTHSWSNILNFAGYSEVTAFELLQHNWSDYSSGKPAKRVAEE